MATYTIKRALFAITISVIVVGCAKEAEEQPQEQEHEELHEVVFHAGWAPETKTVLQEDGSVWWSPGDEISLFVGSGKNGGYKLTSSNTEPAATVDFVGQIGGSASTYTAIYPYNESNRVDGNSVYFTIPAEQVAKEGTFAEGALVSIAVSEDENLYFRNLCGGIKFSVANEGIKKIEIIKTSGLLAGNMMFLKSEDITCHGYQVSNTVTVLAPNDDVFEPGKYYYAVVAPSENNTNDSETIQINFYTDDSIATTNLPGCLFKRSVFKRLYEADKDLKFKKLYDSWAIIDAGILPEGIDKTVITEAYFHVSDPTTTDVVISEGTDTSEPVYFETIGTEVHFYTTGQVYKCRSVNFGGWTSLLNLDLSMFDTSEVTSFDSAFMNCLNLQSLNISSFDTSNAWNLSWMFGNCEKLLELDVANFNTSKATHMSAMFHGCHSLKRLDVSSWNTSSCENMSSIFANCYKLEQLDISHWDVSSCTILNGVFSGCYLLKQIDVSSWNTSSCVDFSNMFDRCRSLELIDVSHFNTSNAEDFQSMFQYCDNLRTIELANWETGKVKNTKWMFANCKALTDVDLSKWDFGEVINAEEMFECCYSLKSLALPNTQTTKLQSIKEMFFCCSNLTDLSLNGFTTSSVTSMEGLFAHCSSLSSLDLSSFDTSNVTTMNCMFLRCTGLTKLDLSSFDTRSVSDIGFMFCCCYNLSALNLSSFDRAPLEIADYSLDGLVNMSRLDLGNVSLSSLTSLENTFGLSCSFSQLGERVSHCYIRCSAETKNTIIGINEGMGTNPKYIWYSAEESLPEDIDGRDPDLYYSADFSMDRKVTTKQVATEGNGLDIILMGDGFSDRLIADGTYDAAMNAVLDAIFSEEPFKSFKHLFNIYVVYAVSENEVIGKNTAFMTYDSREATTGAIGSYDEDKVRAYANLASSKGDAREFVPIVVLNSPINDGVVKTVFNWRSPYLEDPNWDDYHGGENIAYISGPFTPDISYTAIHEMGHAFGQLADEYEYDGYGDYNNNEYYKSLWPAMCLYGMYKNIDFTGDVNSVKWKHFLNDERYTNENLGCFEGALHFNYGVWRPTENSIMRNDHQGHYNAPSREAIYYRIHKLAYGKDWQYNNEEFVQWDQKNIRQPSPAPAKHLASQLMTDRKPVFKMETVVCSGDKRMIRFIMR